MSFKTLFAIVVSIVSISTGAIADEGNTRYPRVMACQNSPSRIYLEVFHDQGGFMGAPINPVGYLVTWSSVMGKDTQKRLVLDVEMKQKTVGNDCALEFSWSNKASSGADAMSYFSAKVASCNLMNLAPKGKLTQVDVYKNGKTETTTVDLECQLQ